jgi:hypothetical protein
MCRRTPASFTVDLLIAAYPGGSTTSGDYVQQGYGGGSSAAQIKFNIIRSNRRIRHCDFILFYLPFFIFLLILSFLFFSFRFLFKSIYQKLDDIGRSCRRG